MRTLKDRLSRLGYRKACRLLGEQGEALIRQGGRYEIDIAAQVKLTAALFSLNLDRAQVRIALDPGATADLKPSCSRCSVACEHIGAAFSLILEEKLALGLAAPPPERTPVESLSQEALVERALADRRERARSEKLRLRSADPKKLWTDYTVTSYASGKTYRVALRGWERGESYCACPDFRRNKLGTCKHILYALDKVKRRFTPRQRSRPYRRRHVSLHLRYGQELELWLLLPDGPLEPEVDKLLAPFANRPIDDVKDLLAVLRRVEAAGREVTVYPDAHEHIDDLLFKRHIRATVDAIRRAPERHALRRKLLKSELLPYQLDGIAFAVGAGRAILADDMGLGKTIQGIGVATLLRHEAGIEKVLIICPASLKSQWRSEIQRFSDHGCRLVLGTARERAEQYGEAFFTICNYEQVLRDIESIEIVDWDLVILDEGQRIKNWEAKTSRIVKGLRSPYALVLTGTPLENRLDDLFSVVEFVDGRMLGPAFEFFNTHRVVDERGRVLGYKNLDALRRKLAPVLLRRTRQQVAQQLPPRSTEVIKITPTEEQMNIHDGHKRIVATIIRKRYISEMDLLRLQKALLMCRLAANGTYLVDKQEPGFSSKLEQLDSLLEELAAEEDRKIVLFSEWTTMLDLIEPLARKHALGFQRLDGSVPQKKRQQLIAEFQTEPRCRLFLSTNAGATGLNLQAANTVINVDLPWNPAVLEQRISRVHRMGQTHPVQVFLLISEGTLEEGLLATLSAKHQLAMAALDLESQVAEVDLQSGIEELRRRLEVLLGRPADAPIDERTRSLEEREAARLAQQRERIAAAGGQLLASAFNLLGELMPGEARSPAMEELTGALRARLEECLDTTEDGGVRLTVSFPDASALDGLAGSLARLVASRAAGEPGPSQ